MLAAVAIAFKPHGVPNVFEMALLAWLVAGFLIAYLQARAGRDDSAHVLSAVAFTGLVTTAAFTTGGLTSFAAIWLVLVPVEAALSGSRQVVALVSIVALGAAGFLLLMGALDPQAPTLAPAAEPSLPAVLGIVSALLYAMGLALGSQTQARASDRLDHAEEGRQRLLARNMTDVVTRVGRNGHVLFVSPAAEPLFGAELRALHGRGLFDRVHVADRPAYLTALSDVASLRESRTIELRIRRDSIASGAGGGFIWIEMRCWPLDPAAQPDGGREGEVVGGHARHHRQKGRGARDRRCAGRGRARECGQEPVPRHHESRAANPAQCHHRIFGDAAGGRRADDRRQAAARLRATDQRVRYIISCRSSTASSTCRRSRAAISRSCRSRSRPDR